jgi:NAD(P)H-hydrate repair Nnr-like enzyme with NAD(P)H-hydrate epimerase domain
MRTTGDLGEGIRTNVLNNAQRKERIMANLSDSQVRQYSANIYQVAQQKGSRLRDKVTIETLNGEIRFFERVGTTQARAKTGTFEDSPVIATPFSRRAIIPHDYDWGDMIESLQKLKTLIDPASAIVTAGGYALGRSIDDEIIAAATGNAYSGKDGTTTVALPSTQKVAVTVGNGGSGNTGLNLAKLIAAKSLFGMNDVDLDDPSNELHMAVSQKQLDNLLAVTEIKSTDYNTVKALVEGKVDGYMGFKFVRTQRLAVASNIRTCFAWAKSGISVAIPQEINAKVTERADKCFNWYAYAALSVAAARMEEEKVVEVSCDESV